MGILCFIVGFGGGYFFAWLILQQRIDAAAEELAKAEEAAKLAEADREYQAYEKEIARQWRNLLRYDGTEDGQEDKDDADE